MSENTKNEQPVKKMPELLAPAGDFQAFLGAVNAGADAVYLAGNLFGARAYAKNFSEEEILEALLYAHVHGKKIYLTVNTLTKNEELKKLFDFLKPFYLAGLDGVIVQDFGVFQYIRNVFPELPVHVSTQMCITSVWGAKEMQKLGATRIVPARELSLDEIREINALGIETECFIHGSMCYCYSGQCLFSSFLGNRSGNRGRCAGPCRQPYCLEGEKNEEYLLSLKDLCTLQILPKLIDAGISSFKIEGRMKSAAYAAGVSSIYRKYIDYYCSLQNKAEYKTEKKDLETLKSLYLRTDLQDGYYEKSKSRNMVSIKSPSYNKTDDSLCGYLNETYCRNKIPVKIPAGAEFEIGKEAKIHFEVQGKSKTVTGDIVDSAKNAPLSEEDLIKRLQKSSSGYFSLEIKDCSLSDGAFLPVGQINALRRKAEEFCLEEIRNAYLSREIREDNTIRFPGRSDISTDDNKIKKKNNNTPFIIFVSSTEQLKRLSGVLSKTDEICFPLSFFENDSCREISDILTNNGELRYFVSLPSVIRSANVVKHKENIRKALMYENIKGFYVSQPDSLKLTEEVLESGNTGTREIRGDLSFYIANGLSSELFKDRIRSYTLSPELSKNEIRGIHNNHHEIMIYGRIPLMQTANCVLNTTGRCGKTEGFRKLTDRLGACFPIYTHCNEIICYNTIYNSVPLSLHKHMRDLFSFDSAGLQLRFTNENPKDCEFVYHIFDRGREGELPENVPYEYTNGHFLKGVL